ncbi:MAG: hypothetical protein NPIRA05_03630 [Nitrospirales bacterium]|nr:MAG: hypothetical protein NPIRA05_03630 [Nitrospirales bacterium]
MRYPALWMLCLAVLFLPVVAAAQKTSIPEPAHLPISKVVLYTSGVGYFQHDGTVKGQTDIQLPVRVTEMNDLLKSLVVQDFDGGTISSIQYQSQDPLAKTLSSFSIDLSNHPTLGQLLTQLRGEPVQLTTPTPVTGTIVGVEKKTEWNKTGTASQQIEVEYVNILARGRLQSLPLSHIQEIEVLNHTLNKELQQVLAVLAQSHDRQKKTITITFEGEDERRVRLVYLRETPVWKTSYRLVLQDNDVPFLQGWGIIDNTTDHDWEQIQLSLVSGRPISFTMDLYQPLYAPRPFVRPELHASLTPKTHGDSLSMETDMKEERQIASRKNRTHAKRFNDRQALRHDEDQDAMMGFSAPAAAESRMETDWNLRQGVQAAAQGQETGELFSYVIQTPVSIPRHGSAMLPILNQAVTGKKLSLYNSTTHAKHPLQAFRLKNVTDLSLMQGPITVFDDHAYAGDAQMNDLAPGQDRLISYALDLNTEVHRKPIPLAQELVSATLQKGVLIATRKALKTTTYTVTNRSQKQKTVLVEHPYRSDWKLVNTTTPVEQTRNMYRFAMTVDTKKTESLTVQEGKSLEETVSLITAGHDIIGVYLKAQQVSPDVKTALERVVELRQQLSHTQNARQQHESRITNMAKDQKRIRDNMHRLSQQNQLYTRYVKKLHAQETELETIQQEIDALVKKEISQKQALDEYVMGLEID